MVQHHTVTVGMNLKVLCTFCSTKNSSVTQGKLKLIEFNICFEESNISRKMYASSTSCE